MDANLVVDADMLAGVTSGRVLGQLKSRRERMLAGHKAPAFVDGRNQAQEPLLVGDLAGPRIIPPGAGATQLERDPIDRDRVGTLDHGAQLEWSSDRNFTRRVQLNAGSFAKQRHQPPP